MAAAVAATTMLGLLAAPAVAATTRASHPAITSTVTAVSPSTGPTVGGTKVTVTGKGFSHVTGVYFGKTKASKVAVASTKKLTAFAPAHLPGKVAVTVKIRGGSTGTAGHFTYTPTPVAALTAPGAMSHTIALRWQSPREPGYAGVVIRRATGTTPPARPTAGTAVATVPAGKSTYLVTGLVPNKTYAFSVFAKESGGKISVRRSVVAKTLSWGSPQLADRLQGQPASISCPSTTLCYALDEYSNVFTESSGTWSGPTHLSGLDVGTRISCPSTTFCVASGGTSVALDNAGTWTFADLGGLSIADLSCAPGTTFCVAVDYGGNALTYNGGAAGDWTKTAVSGIALTSVSCPTTLFCAAGDANGAYIDNSGSWSSETTFNGGAGFSISCPTSTYCIASDGGGIFKYNGSSWADQGGTGEFSPDLYVSCASATFCGGTDDVGTADIWNGSSWIGGSDSAAVGYQSTGISCVATQCTTIDLFGTSSTFTSSWSQPTTFDTFNAIYGISCATKTSCRYLSQAGQTATYDGAHWSTPVDSGLFSDAESISCPTASYCAAVGPGELTQYTTSGGWTQGPEVNAVLVSISCPTTHFCGAVSEDGKFVFTNGSGVSSPGTIDGDAFLHIACYSATMCAAVDSARRLLTFDGTTWTNPSTVDAINGVDSVSCPGPHFCVAVDTKGDATYFTGAGWTAPTPVYAGHSLGLVTCVNAGYCYAVSGHNMVGFGPGIAASVDPLADSRGFQDLSCVAGACMVLDTEGFTVRGS